MRFEVAPLFQARKDGYHTFRIPALAATPTGTLLVFCAARHGRGGDWDPIDIAMRRSTDGGATWEPMQVFATDGPNTVDNPTPIVDAATGTVHFLYQINYARVYYRRSEDDGVTFSEPVDITPTLERFRLEYDWRVVAPGPGHGVRLKNGRLLVAVWMSTGAGTEFGAGNLGHRPSCVGTIYSDDEGKTWERGKIVVHTTEETPNPSETMPVELEDGRVLLSIRTESCTNRRLFAWSADGATGRSTPEFQDDLFEPICMASILRLSGGADGGRSRILYSNPDSRDTGAAIREVWGIRRNLTVRLSYDEGRTWPVHRVIDPGFAGYSDLAATSDGMIFCLYEGGGIEGNMFDNAQVSIARFDLGWLTEGADELE